MSHFVKLAVLTLGSLTAALSFGAVNAATPESPPSVVVKYSEQSLATDEGVYALYRRITAAARRVCPDAGTRDWGLKAQVEQCRNQAIAQAIRKIDNSRLAALHAAHSKNG